MLGRRPLLAIAFRYACFCAMVWMTLLAEVRPAPTLPDAVLAYVPYVPWVDRWNYVAWVLAYIPVAVWLWRKDAERFVRYMVSAGLLALVRGLCILATGLGPVRGADVNAGMSFERRAQAFLELVSFAPVFTDEAARVYLTKDLFFSGHVATTFLLLLYVWRFEALRRVELAGHLLVLATVFLAHLHYTIDVVGAYAVAFALFCLREVDLRSALGAAPAPAPGGR